MLTALCLGKFSSLSIPVSPNAIAAVQDGDDDGFQLHLVVLPSRYWMLKDLRQNPLRTKDRNNLDLENHPL